MKVRLDQLVVERGLAPSRDAAKRLILAGEIFVDGERRDKAGKSFARDADVGHRGRRTPYVGRGGLKLEAALKAFGVHPEAHGLGLDIGASTGGFTDCLLQHGIGCVIAVDVGRGQIHQRLRADPRVRLLEKTNARHLTLEDMGGTRVDTIVIDVSFISLRLILPPCRDLIREGGEVIALVKPQFEAGRGQVGSGGIVRDASVLENVVREMDAFCRESGWDVRGWIVSPIRGAEGNVEFFVYLRTTEAGAATTGAEVSPRVPGGEPGDIPGSMPTLAQALEDARRLIGDKASEVSGSGE